MMTSPARGRGLRLTENRILIANAIAILLTLLAVAGALPRPTIWVVILAFATVSTVALIVVVRVRNRLRGFVGAIANASTTVVDGQALVPPDVASLIDELTGQGFSVVGVVDTSVAGRPDFRTWILTEPSGETWVEAGQAIRAIAVVLSGLGSGRQVEAAWPGGMRIDEPELRAAPASATLALTLADHRARVAAERRAEAQLGTPPLDPGRPEGWRIRTFDDYLAWEPIQRGRTGGLRLRTELRRRIEPTIRLWALSTVVGLVCGGMLAAVP